METFRKTDTKLTEQVDICVDKHVLSDKELFACYERVYDKNLQLLGCDIIITTTDGRIKNGKVDEKSANSYVNRPLFTFSHELSSINNDAVRRDGWLLAEGLITEYYLYIWPRKADIPQSRNSQWEYWKMTCDNLHEFDYALVPKKSIMEYLESIGLTVEKLREINERMLNGEQVDSYDNGNVYFRYSRKRTLPSGKTIMAEEPINAIISDKVLYSRAILKGKKTF